MNIYTYSFTTDFRINKKTNLKILEAASASRKVENSMNQSLSTIACKVQNIYLSEVISGTLPVLLVVSEVFAHSLPGLTLNPEVFVYSFPVLTLNPEVIAYSLPIFHAFPLKMVVPKKRRNTRIQGCFYAFFS